MSLFLENYARASDGLDLQTVGVSLADDILSLDPNSVSSVTRNQLLAVLPGRQQLFAAIGGIGADLTGVNETVRDERHTLVCTTWQVCFGTEHFDADPSALHSTFLLRLEKDG